MGESLTEQYRVNEEVFRYVKFFYLGRKMFIGNDRQVTVLNE